MEPLLKRQQILLQNLSTTSTLSSSTAHEIMLESSEPASLVTIKRDLDTLTELGYCVREGQGRSTTYRLTTFGLLSTPYDTATYLALPPDTRAPQMTYNFDLFASWPTATILPTILQTIDTKTARYRAALTEVTPTIQAKELERFIIELSWKSSVIEGNTYTLLDTERLIRDGIPAAHNSPDETQMILNHKTALDFIIANLHTTLTPAFVEQVHTLLVHDLNIARGIRKTLVGITGTTYTPLDNQFQIKEALDSLYACIERVSHPLEKSLVALAGLSYIQPFEDGNKRTARLISNAILLAHQYAPLSYRSTEVEAYRGAMILFYERNSLVAVRDILVEQYLFSTQHYRVKGV